MTWDSQKRKKERKSQVFFIFWVLKKNTIFKEIVRKISRKKKRSEKIKHRKITTRHITIKLTNTSDREENLKSSYRKKHIVYIEKWELRWQMIFFFETMETRGEWSNIFKVLE